MRLAISISPSRVSSSTVPISRMYMRTGSVVRPNSESTVDSAASAASSASSSVAAVGAAVGEQQRLGVGRLLVDRDAHVVEHRRRSPSSVSASTSFSGRWSLISAWVRKPRVLPSLISVFSSLAALGDLFFGERGLVEAELAHQRALLGAC